MYNSIKRWCPLLVGKANGLVCLMAALFIVVGCTRDYPALVGNKIVPPSPVATSPVTSTTACPCTSPGSSSATVPASSTTTGSSTTSPTGQSVVFDTLKVPPPHFMPDGGAFYMTTKVRLTADTLPPGAVIDYSVDNGQNWITGQQFTLTAGGTILTRVRSGQKLSISRSAQFSIYFQRMMIIGNSIMSHAPAPELGWFNYNGMAASAPEKDFVYLLTAQLQRLYPGIAVKLQGAGNFERLFGTATYSLDEFNDPVQQFKPDLILIRMGENVDDSQVQSRNFETNFRQLLERLVSLSGTQPVKIVCTTSVWLHPQADAVIRKVINEKGYTLVDLSCMIGQGQYFASQYDNPGVAAHPNDVGMQRIANLIWDKIQ